MLFWDCSALFWLFIGCEHCRSYHLVSLMVFNACWQWSWTQDLAQSEAHAGIESSKEVWAQGQESSGFPCFWRGLLCWAGPSLLFRCGCVHPPPCQAGLGRGQGQRLTVVCRLIVYSECLQQHIPDQWCLSWRQAPAVEERAIARGCQESWLLRPRPGSLWWSGASVPAESSLDLRKVEQTEHLKK